MTKESQSVGSAGSWCSGSATAGNGSQSYGGVAIAFHWVMTVLIVVVGVLGLLHDSWPRSSQAFWINIHALIGLMVWVLVIARLSWRPPIGPRTCRRT